jgi:hypothetical protein
VLRHEPGSITGFRIVVRKVGRPDTIAIDLPAGDDVLERHQLASILPWLPLREGASFRLPVFDAEILRIDTVRVDVRRTRVDLARGRESALRVSVTGSIASLPIVQYLSVNPPHAILRHIVHKEAVWELVPRR